MIAVGVLLAEPGGAARIQPLPDDLRAAVDAAIAAGGPESAVVLHEPPADAGLLARGLAQMRETNAAGVVAAAPQTDTLKLATPTGLIERTIERSRTYDVRLPQIYRAGDLRAALARGGPEVVEQAIRDGDHALLPGLVDGVVRVLSAP